MIADRLYQRAYEIRTGGFPVLRRFAFTMLGMGLAALPLLLVRALRPVVTVRFGMLMSGRIGHFAPNTEIYLCERDAGYHGSRVIDVFSCGGQVCNQQLKIMWSRSVFMSGFARHMDQLNRRIPGYKHHMIPWRDHQDHDIHGLLAQTEPHLSFTAKEEVRGQAALRELGIPEGAPFVCFHARDSSYLDGLRDDRAWQYHDYRDSNIDAYVPAMEELARRGYFGVRMGASVKESLETTNPMIIDYATNGRRTDFLDIYLGAKCEFCLGDTAGIYAIPTVFRKPIAFVNYVPLGIIHSWNPYDLSIPKLLWLGQEKRNMTFRQIMQSDSGMSLKSEEYQRRGIELIDNTPEEITALAVEMDERLEGTWEATEEDQELQGRFWSLFAPNEVHGALLSKIGADFLRRHRDLLD